MNAQTHTPSPMFDRIFHPTDFSPASEIAFAHALKLAVMARTTLCIIHVPVHAADTHWSDFPGVRAMLARWGLLPEGSARHEVEKIGLSVEKILTTRGDPVRALRQARTQSSADLLVLATHQRTGVARWMHHAVAEPMARRARTMTLFVPQGVKGFIAHDNGAVTLRRILIPIDHVPRPQAAVDAATGLARGLNCPEVAFTLVHVGATADLSAVHEPHHAGWTWERTIRHGEVVEEILALSTACAADLIVLTTQGHHGLLDALRGSTSERILRGAQCPVLAIPAS